MVFLWSANSAEIKYLMTSTKSLKSFKKIRNFVYYIYVTYLLFFKIEVVVVQRKINMILYKTLNNVAATVDKNC